jgi:hypothetical protein
MLVTHTRTPLSGDRISVHQVTSNLTEATRNHTRNHTTKSSHTQHHHQNRSQKIKGGKKKSYETAVR